MNYYLIIAECTVLQAWIHLVRLQSWIAKMTLNHKKKVNFFKTEGKRSTTQ